MFSFLLQERTSTEIIFRVALLMLKTKENFNYILDIKSLFDWSFKSNGWSVSPMAFCYTAIIDLLPMLFNHLLFSFMLLNIRIVFFPFRNITSIQSIIDQREWKILINIPFQRPATPFPSQSESISKVHHLK